jgi:hypothetical protein
MLIQEKPLSHWIDNFYGYGSWDARVWFVGYEEGGGDLPEDVADRINYFYNAHPTVEGGTLCDIRRLYRNVALRIGGPKAHIFQNRYEYRFDSKAVLHGVWKNLVAFEHGYKNEPLPDPLEYQKNSFLSTSQCNEALIQFYPLPSPHNHAWYYSWLDLPQFPFLKDRTLYQDHVYHNRINTILNRISEHKPDVVLMYAMDNINQLKKSVQEVFDSAQFKMVKAVKQRIPQHHLTHVTGTNLIITTQLPALRHGRVETGFDWLEFGKAVRDQTD